MHGSQTNRKALPVRTAAPSAPFRPPDQKLRSPGLEFTIARTKDAGVHAWYFRGTRAKRPRPLRFKRIPPVLWWTPLDVDPGYYNEGIA